MDKQNGIIIMVIILIVIAFGAFIVMRYTELGTFLFGGAGVGKTELK